MYETSILAVVQHATPPDTKNFTRFLLTISFRITKIGTAVCTHTGQQSVHIPGSSLYTYRAAVCTHTGQQSVHIPDSSLYTYRTAVRTHTGQQSVHIPDSSLYTYRTQSINSYELVPGTVHYHVVLISQNCNVMLVSCMSFRILVF